MCKSLKFSHAHLQCTSYAECMQKLGILSAKFVLAFCGNNGHYKLYNTFDRFRYTKYAHFCVHAFGLLGSVAFTSKSKHQTFQNKKKT